MVGRGVLCLCSPVVAAMLVYFICSVNRQCKQPEPSRHGPADWHKSTFFSASDTVYGFHDTLIFSNILFDFFFLTK